MSDKISIVSITNTENGPEITSNLDNVTVDFDKVEEFITGFAAEMDNIQSIPVDEWFLDGETWKFARKYENITFSAEMDNSLPGKFKVTEFFDIGFGGGLYEIMSGTNCYELDRMKKFIEDSIDLRCTEQYIDFGYKWL